MSDAATLAACGTRAASAARPTRPAPAGRALEPGGPLRLGRKGGRGEGHDALGRSFASCGLSDLGDLLDAAGAAGPHLVRTAERPRA